ncbi:MAG: hypothetical protein VW397_06320, partial [Candidatus Margulisiibacteriota bacterium]
LKGVGAFLRRIFISSKDSSSKNNLSQNVDISNAQTISDSVSSKAHGIQNLTENNLPLNTEISNAQTISDSASSIADAFQEALSKRFGPDFSINSLKSKMLQLGFKDDVKKLETISDSKIESKLDAIDGLRSKVACQVAVNDIKSTVLSLSDSKDDAIVKLVSKFKSFHKTFLDTNGKLKPNVSKEFFNDLTKDIHSMVDQFKSDLKSDFSSTDSHIKKEMVEIKTDVLRSTNIYVKSGEVEYKQLVGKAYQRASEFIELAVSKREDSIKTVIQSHTPQASNESQEDYQTRINDFFDKVKNLYTEKHFHLTASTLQGDQYVKGWATQGRDDSKIQSDIHQICGSNSVFVDGLNRQFDSILSGLSETITASSTKLIQSAYKNDLITSRMKAVHEITVGLDKFLNSLKDRDLSNHSLSSIVNDLKQVHQVMQNFKLLSRAFVTGEDSLTHIDKGRIKSMVESMLPQNLFSLPESKAEFITKISDYVLDRLEKKGLIDSAENDFGNIHSDKLDGLKVKDTLLLNNDDFKILNEDKVKGAWSGRVGTRGPFNRAFVAYTDSIKAALNTHLSAGKPVTPDALKPLIEASISAVNCFDDQGQDQRSQIIEKLMHYTDEILKKSGVISTGDAGLIKAPGTQTTMAYTKQVFYGQGQRFVLKSSKSEFLNSEFYQKFRSQFDAITPTLEQHINDVILTGLSQGQVGELRQFIQEIKQQPRMNISETLAFKSKLAGNRIYSLFSSSTYDKASEFDALSQAKGSVDKITAKGVDDPEQEARDLRMNINSTSELASQEIENQSNSFENNMLAVNEHIQSSVNSLLDSDFYKSLSEAQAHSGDENLEKTSEQLRSAVSNVETSLQDLRKFLVGSANIALDHVDDVLMSVPYIGELYSALAIAKDVKDGYFATTKMDQMKSQLELTTSFNRYLTNSSIQQDQLTSNVQAFSSMMQLENKRDEASFSLLVHVANALSPPGVNVGSALKTIKNIVKMPTLDPKSMDKIAQEVMTVNKDFHMIASKNKDIHLNALMDSLKNQDSDLNDFSNRLISASDTLPSSDDFMGVLNQRLFDN